MGFQEAIRTCLREKYVTFSGRASRSEYWFFVLFSYLLILGVGALFFLFGGMGAIENGSLNAAHYILLIAYVIITLGLFLPSISVLVRRFHDRNMSGWWVLALMVAGAIPFVGILATIGLLVLLCLKGTDGENRFGDDPLNPSTGADVFS